MFINLVSLHFIDSLYVFAILLISALVLIIWSNWQSWHRKVGCWAAWGGRRRGPDPDMWQCGVLKKAYVCWEVWGGESRVLHLATWSTCPGKGCVQGGLGGRKERALSRVGARSCHKSTFMSKTPDQTFSCRSQIVSSPFTKLLYNVVSAKYKLNIHGIPTF